MLTANRRHAIALLLSLTALYSTACHQRPTVDPGYHEYAYVTNGKSNSVSVLDLLQLKNVKTVAVGASPTGVAANPKRNEIYVANAEFNNISIIDAERNEVVATIGVHRAPYFVSVSSDGKRAYVANSGSANVSVIDVNIRRAGVGDVGAQLRLVECFRHRCCQARGDRYYSRRRRS